MQRGLRRNRAFRMIEQCNLAYIPAATVKWMEYIQEGYQQQFRYYESEALKRQTEAEARNARPPKEADHNAMILMFRGMKGEMPRG